MEHLDTILKQTDLIFKNISTNVNNAQSLLENANRLSTIMYNIAELWVAAKSESDNAKLLHEDKYDTVFLEYKAKEKTSDKTSEAMARIECREMYKDWLTKDTLSRKLYLLRVDIDRKSSVIQSYAAELRSQLTYRKGGEPT